LSSADDCQRHYESEVTEHLREVTGFVSARLLRREVDAEVMFTSITVFSGLDGVRGFAGEDYERAVVEDAARSALTRWDEQVAHHDVAVEISRPGEPVPQRAPIPIPLDDQQVTQDHFGRGVGIVVASRSPTGKLSSSSPEASSLC